MRTCFDRKSAKSFSGEKIREFFIRRSKGGLNDIEGILMSSLAPMLG
jgi:hypothetical protein